MQLLSFEQNNGANLINFGSLVKTRIRISDNNSYDMGDYDALVAIEPDIGVVADHATEYVDENTWLTLVDVQGKSGGFIFVNSAGLVTDNQVKIKITLDGAEKTYIGNIIDTVNSQFVGFCRDAANVVNMSVPLRGPARSMGLFEKFNESLLVEILYSRSPSTNSVNKGAICGYFTDDVDGGME